MSIEPPANDPLHYLTGGGAADGARTGPPPLTRPPINPEPEAVGNEPAIEQPSLSDSGTPQLPRDEVPVPSVPKQLAPEAPPFQPDAMPDASHAVAPPPPTEHEDLPWRVRVRRYITRSIAAFVAWSREEGYWYLSSMAFHALLIMALALVSLAIPHALMRAAAEKAPSFDAPKTEPETSQPIERFVVGDAPLEPSQLNPEMLDKFTPEPIGGQTEKYYDDSPDFEEAGGGFASNLDLPKLGGLGGLYVDNRPGPAGRGGVGISEGTGNNPGFGGDGDGFGQRGKGSRKAILGPAGGTPVTERAVAAALNWLARHQSPLGRWSLDYHGQCRGGVCSGASNVQADTAATGLALLPFLAAGQTHKNKGIYKETVAKGLAWLIKQQRPDGDLSGNCPRPMYAHGIATLALCEAYGMTKDEHVGSAARRAVAYIERAQNESTGGWRYTPGETGDTSVFGWQIMALKSAQLAGLSVNSIVFENAQKWLHSVAKGEHLGLYSYQPYREVTPTMTAVGLLCRQYLGIDPKDPSVLESKGCLLENLPNGRVGRNSYYWYYATLAMHNFADRDWDTWNRRMRRVLIESQDKEGCAMGSWDPDHPTVDAWGPQGGRLMLTCLNALTLEVYYRHLPLFKTDSLVPDRGQKMGFTKPIATDDE